MASNTAKLGQLRPVTFYLKTDPRGALQYGLIAEEVAKVYPELVIRGEKGRIDGVRYDELAPMLLNEMQKQQNKSAAQAKINAAQAEKIESQAAQLREVQQQLGNLQVALTKLQAKEELVANR
jgi:Chaperone of endosialidase